MKNNIPNENELPEFDPTEYGGDELGRCKSYLKRTVQYLEKECLKTAELERQLAQRDKYVESLEDEIEKLHHDLFWNKDPYAEHKKYLLAITAHEAKKLKDQKEA